MPRRPDITLLFIGSTVVARADISGCAKSRTSKVYQEQLRARGAGEELVRTTLGLAGRPAPSVWILCESAWTQTLALPQSATVGLDPGQLAKALAFEVEALSGNSASQTALGCWPLTTDRGGSAVFWISHLSAQERRVMQDAVTRAGATLRGIVHPGGLPGSLSDSDRPHWKRIEQWQGATLCLDQSPSRGMQVHVVSAEPGRENWRRELGRWHSQTNGAPGEWLGAQAEGVDFLDGPERWTMLPPLTGKPLEQWMLSWAACLEASTPPVPVIASGEPIVRLGHYVAAAAALLVLACIAAVSHHTWVRHQVAGSGKELAVLQQPRRDLEASKRMADAHRAELERLTKANESAQAALRRPAEDLSTYRRSVLGALTEIAACADSEVMVDRIDEDGDGAIRLRGLALLADSADRYALRLSTALTNEGWIVSPAEKEARWVNAEGGPWSYSIRIAPGVLGAGQPATPPAPAEKGDD